MSSSSQNSGTSKTRSSSPNAIVKSPRKGKAPASEDSFPRAEDYSRYTQKQHIYNVPDTYVGSDEFLEREEWLLNLEELKMVKSRITLPQAVERLYLEILSNAGDNADRSRRANVQPGSIHITMDEKIITIRNEGVPIPVEIHPTEKVYIPEMIFGTLLTSSNYDATKVRMGCGRNGYGSKLVNIFSHQFTLEVGDAIRKKHYIQKWEHNMDIRQEPTITDYKEKTSFVQISYFMDFERFKMSGYPPEAFGLFSRYASDFSLTCKVPVVFNGVPLNYMKIQDYCTLYFGQVEHSLLHYEKAEIEYTDNGKKMEPIPTVEMCLIDTPDSGVTISFVNGIMTTDGGVHVNAAFKALSIHILEAIHKTAKDKIQLNIADVKPHISMILSCRLPDPKYTSQTKTILASPTPKISMSEEELRPIAKWSLMDRLYAALEAKQFKNLSKTDGKKKRHVGLEKGEDANDAGTSRSTDCTLYVVEGKSAMGYAVKAISLIPNGRDRFGVLPLKGKPLNVMNATAQQIAENQEFVELKKMLGLREGLDYTLDENFDTLRYGYLVILADSDDDGKHIIGLILNLFHCRYPTLLQRGYVMYLRTPILRVYQNKNVQKFYTYGEYLQWREATADWQSWKHKYYKGLGTSKDADIADDFRAPRIVVSLYDEQAPLAFDLAFNDRLADQRKKWIAEWKEAFQVEMIQRQPISDFIHQEFIQFSIANLHRSIPRLLDGLKISQRKVMWAAIKKWGSKGDENLLVKNPEEMKVARFAAYAAESTNYHHGEKCLEETIITMAQDFVGANNMPYFTRDGQFGTRNMGGDDAAETRYSETRPEWWIPLVFKKQDLPLFEMVVDEGEEVEPVSFLPILPMQLVNGSNGIGTGHSTFIPNHHPLHLVDWLRCKMNGEDLPTLLPWYRDYTGTIELIDRSIPNPNKRSTKKKVVQEEVLEGDDEKIMKESVAHIPRLAMVTKGKFKPMEKNKLCVLELPIGRWTNPYAKWLEHLVEERKIHDFRNLSTANTVKFEITGFAASTAENLKLIKAYGMTNMVLLNQENRPLKFYTVGDMMEKFFEMRLPYYSKRKEYYLQKYDKKIATLNERIRFIEALLRNQLKIIGEPKDKIVAQMKKLGLNEDLLGSVKMSHCTQEEIDSLKEETENVEQEREDLGRKSPESLWLSDLDEFEREYRKYYKL